MENDFDENEKRYLETYWTSQDLTIENSYRTEIDKLILLSRRKSILESNQFINARNQGIHLIRVYKDSSQIKNWVKEFVIRYDNLSQKEFKYWLIQERNRIIEKAKKVKKHSFYFDILKTIKTILKEDEIGLKSVDLKNKLLNMLKEDKIKECFLIFEEHKINSDELLLIQSQWNNIKKLKRTGQIEFSSFIDENRLRDALLNLINNIE